MKNSAKDGRSSWTPQLGMWFAVAAAAASLLVLQALSLPLILLLLLLLLLLLARWMPVTSEALNRSSWRRPLRMRCSMR